MMKPRAQKVMVIRRKSDGLFYYAPKGSTTPQWSEDLEQANFIAPSKVKSLIRVDWGRDLEDYEVLEVVPKLKEEDNGHREPH